MSYFKLNLINNLNLNSSNLKGIHLFFNKKSSALNARLQTAVTPKEILGASLVREAWWLVLVLIGLYLTVILTTYNPEDPSWSHIKSQAADQTMFIHNSGGAVGAWVSDMMLYLFGFSAWWWVVQPGPTLWQQA